MKGLMRGHFPTQDVPVSGRAQFVPSHKEGIRYSSDDNKRAPARLLCSWSTLSIWQQQAIRLPCSLHSKCKQPPPGSEIHTTVMCRGDQTLI